MSSKLKPEASASRTKMDVFDKAAGYLAFQPRTEAEIRAYLKKKEYSPSEIDDGIAKLLEYQYLDDTAYACSFIRQAAAKGWGRRKMEQELMGKGVSRTHIEAAWARLEDESGESEESSCNGVSNLFDEKKRALEIGVKMTRQQLEAGKNLDEKFLARVGRRLSGQGYSSDVIYFVVNKLRGLKR